MLLLYDNQILKLTKYYMNTKWNIKLTGLVLVLFLGLLAPLSPTLYTNAADETVACNDTDINNICDETATTINDAIDSAGSGFTVTLTNLGGTDYSLTSTIEVDSGVTLDCDSATITSSANPAIKLFGTARLSNCSLNENIQVMCTNNGSGSCTEGADQINDAIGSVQANNSVLLTDIADTKYAIGNVLNVEQSKTLDCNSADLRSAVANTFTMGQDSQLHSCIIDMTAQQTAVLINGTGVTIGGSGNGNTFKGFDDAWLITSTQNNVTVSHNTFLAGTGASYYKAISSSGTGATFTSNTMTGAITKGIEISGGNAALKSNSITSSSLTKGTDSGQAHTGIGITGGSATHTLGNTTNQTEGNTVNGFNTCISTTHEADIHGSDIDNCTTGILHNSTAAVDSHTNNIDTTTTGISITNTGNFSSNTDTLSNSTTGININAAVTSDIDNLTSNATNTTGINITSHTSTTVDGSTFNLDDDSKGVVIAADANNLELSDNKFLDDGDETADEIAIENSDTNTVVADYNYFDRADENTVSNGPIHDDDDTTGSLVKIIGKIQYSPFYTTQALNSELIDYRIKVTTAGDPVYHTYLANALAEAGATQINIKRNIDSNSTDDSSRDINQALDIVCDADTFELNAFTVSAAATVNGCKLTGDTTLTGSATLKNNQIHATVFVSSNTVKIGTAGTAIHLQCPEPI